MRQIYCVNVSETSAAPAAAFVLDDFKDAYAAYERMTASAGEDPLFSFVSTALDADTVLVAFDEPQQACELMAKLPHGAKVYGVCLANLMPSQATAGIETACKHFGCIWQGVFLITKKPAKVIALSGKPRMGWRRRKLSEATDRLIACVRAGVSIEEAVELFGASKKQRTQARRNLILV